MKARRRSPVVLALGVVSALGAAPAAASGPATGGRRQPAAAWREVPEATWRTAPPDSTRAPAAAGPRLAMVFQTGWQHMWAASSLWDDRRRSLFSLDLGMTVRGDDGHRWGGAVTGFWYSGDRRNLALKAVRRWTLEEVSGSYAQLAPGLLVTGQDDHVDLDPGLLLEAELGNKWVALTTGLHAQRWSGGLPGGRQESDLDLTWTLGGRVHGAVGAGAVAVLYLAVIIAFASSSEGWN